MVSKSSKKYEKIEKMRLNRDVMSMTNNEIYSALVFEVLKGTYMLSPDESAIYDVYKTNFYKRKCDPIPIRKKFGKKYLIYGM